MSKLLNGWWLFILPAMFIVYIFYQPTLQDTFSSHENPQTATLTIRELNSIDLDAPFSETNSRADFSCNNSSLLKNYIAKNITSFAKYNTTKIINWCWGKNERTITHLTQVLNSNTSKNKLGLFKYKNPELFKNSNNYENAIKKQLHLDLAKIIPYAKYIMKAAKDNDVDPILIIALMYQESKFDNNAVSPTGVRGIMQLSMRTGNFFGSKNSSDPKTSILAATKYLRYLYDKISNKSVAKEDRWLLALAAYNQGYGNLQDAQRLARKMGKNASKWSTLKDMYKLLANPKKEYELQFGGCRGLEAIAHVEKIRYYYYILYKLSLANSKNLDVFKSKNNYNSFLFAFQL